MVWMEMYNPDLMCSMYDVDGNGWIDLLEMTHLIQSIYQVMGTSKEQAVQVESAEERARDIFKQMDRRRVHKTHHSSSDLNLRFLNLPHFSVLWFQKCFLQISTFYEISINTASQ